MVKVKDTASFIERAMEVHGDRYDYSQTVYVANRASVVITCRKCGDFIISEARDHYQSKKCGCGKCNHAIAMNKKRKHPKKTKVSCEKCGRLTQKKGGICQGCVEPSKCVCGMTTRNRYATHCNDCAKWGKELSYRLTAKLKRYRKLNKLNSDCWLKWAANKQATMVNRVRIEGRRNIQSNVYLSEWISWADHNKKTKLRGVESQWQRKCRNWKRSLSTRSRVVHN